METKTVVPSEFTHICMNALSFKKFEELQKLYILHFLSQFIQRFPADVF